MLFVYLLFFLGAHACSAGCFFSDQEERSSPGGNEPNVCYSEYTVIAEGCHQYILFLFKKFYTQDDRELNTHPILKIKHRN